MEKKKVTNSIYIDAGAGKVWDALTLPAETKKYMFGCETVSDWKKGSELLWKGNYEGREMVFVKGFILEIIPGDLLRYTVNDPNAAWPDIPENYLQVTYALHEEGGRTELVVSQEGFEQAAEGEKRYKEVYNNGEGWNPILAAIKKQVEADV